MSFSLSSWNFNLMKTGGSLYMESIAGRRALYNSPGLAFHDKEIRFCFTVVEKFVFFSIMEWDEDGSRYLAATGEILKERSTTKYI
jgi:hypothetical protein